MHPSKAHLTKVPKMGGHVLSVCSSFLALPTSVIPFGTAVCGGLITHVASFFLCKEEGHAVNQACGYRDLCPLY